MSTTTAVFLFVCACCILAIVERRNAHLRAARMLSELRMRAARYETEARRYENLVAVLEPGLREGERAALADAAIEQFVSAAMAAESSTLDRAGAAQRAATLRTHFAALPVCVQTKVAVMPPIPTSARILPFKRNDRGEKAG